jgi:hypothetical protein
MNISENRTFTGTAASAVFITAAVLAAPLYAQTYTEVQASPYPLGDMHFDWGRDGIYCPTCNFGESNARFAWTNRVGDLWVGHINPETGAFTPTDGKNELADSSAFYFGEFGNGPDFAFSTQGGQVTSQLVYTRYPPGEAAIPGNAGIAFSTQSAAGWSAAFLPGAMGYGDTGPINTVLYQQTQCATDPIATTLFYDLSSPSQVFWEPVTTAPGTEPTLTPFGGYATFISGGKPGARWVPCTTHVVFDGAAPPDSQGDVYQQVFWYDTGSQAVQQLTTDSSMHTEAFLFQAPDFADNYVLITVANSLVVQIYEQIGVGSNNAPELMLVNQIVSPDPSEPYISEIEPFINCTPTCQTYFFMKLSSMAVATSESAPNGLAISNLNPAQPFFRILVAESSTPTIQRNNPKYYITPNGPYLYYARNTIQSATTSFRRHGRWFIDLQLGVPSGPCVGSSAESGLKSGC